MKKINIKKKKRVFFLTAIIVFAGAYFFLLPQMFQLPVVKQTIHGFLSKQINGSITFGEEKLTVFPVPCIHFQHISVEGEDNFSGTLGQVSVYPHIFSILRGKFNIAQISAADINAAVELPEEQGPVSLETIAPLFRHGLEAWMDTLGTVRQNKFRIDIENVALSLTRSRQTIFSLRSTAGTISWQRPVATLSLDIGTDLWPYNSLTIELDAGERFHSGCLTMEKFTPATAWSYLFPDSALQVENGSLDGSVFWDTTDFYTWHFAVELSDPDIIFRKNDSRFTLRGEKASGKIDLDPSGIQVVVSQLDLDSPGLFLNGKFELDSERPFVGWRINAEDVDLASTGEAALFFAGRFKTTRKIVQVLREGRVPQISLGQEALTPKGLKKVASFHLDGILDHATISVPNADLILTETCGTVTVSEGTLAATDVRTRLGNSTGGQGEFTLALTDEDPTRYYVACDIAADAAQLPPLLQRLVKNESFSREMADISSAEGSAQGAMVLRKTTDDFQVTVDVSKFDLSATYSRIPFPIALSGDGFSYRKKEVRVEGVKGNIGASDVSDITAAFAWESAPQLSISSAKARADARELALWLGDTFPRFRTPDDDAAGTGPIVIDAFQFDGPLAHSGEWRFQADGYVPEHLTLIPPLLPETLDIFHCRFTATHEKIDILDADLSFLGTRLVANGSLSDYLTRQPWTLDAMVVGQMNQTISDWICNQSDIPNAFKWQAPLSAIPLFLEWKKNEGIRVSGQAAGKNGLQLSFDIDKTADTLTVHRLTLDDSGKSATASLALDKDSVEVNFSGTLSRNSLSTLLKDNRLLSGSLRGNFTARLDLAAPFLDSFAGRLQTDWLDLTPAGLPLSIEHLALTGTGTAAEIQSARFSWKNDTISSYGRVERTGQDLVLDVTINGGEIPWESVQALMETTHAGDTARTSSLLGNVQFSCDRFNFSTELALEPLRATLELKKDRIDMVFQEARACGISFPGTLTLMPDQALFSFQPSADQEPLEPTVTCLRKGKVLMDGSYELGGDLTFEWDRETPLAEAIGGTALLRAENGRIYKAVLLGKLFALLNIKEVLSGQFPNLEKDGFPYESSIFSGRFKDGKFELSSGVIDSPAMRLFFEGSEDFIRKEHDLTIVVAPLPSVDAVVDKIPVLNDVLEKGLVIYPIKVSGTWDDPKLALLSPTAVGGEVMGLMLRTLKLPVTIFEKLFPDNNSQKSDD